MKIALVSPHSLTYPGGVQNHTLALKKEFEKKGHKVKLILPRDKISQKKQKDVILLGSAFPIRGNASKATLSFNIIPFSVTRKLKKENFDILHFQNFGVFSSWQILEAARKLDNSPVKILTFHAFLDASRTLRELPTLIDFMNSYILPKFDGLIGVSNPVLSQLEYGGPTKVIPNGIDLDFYSPQGPKKGKLSSNPRINLSDSTLNIFFVGRIEKRKGLIYLIKAFEVLKKKYSNIRLIVAGEGPLKERAQEYIAEHEIPDIYFEGAVSKEDLPKYYRASDICCFPSIYGEAFGIVLLEAMASKKPVLGFANRGYQEVLENKGAQFLAKPRSYKDLSKKMEMLIKDEALRKEMGEWGRKEAQKYSWEKVAEETLNFYEKVIKSNFQAKEK